MVSSTETSSDFSQPYLLDPMSDVNGRGRGVPEKHINGATKEKVKLAATVITGIWNLVRLIHFLVTLLL